MALVARSDASGPLGTPAFQPCTCGPPRLRSYVRRPVAVDTLQRQETVDTYAAIVRSAGITEITERNARAAVKQIVARAKELRPRELEELQAWPCGAASS